MSIRRLMANAAGGLVIACGAVPLCQLHAQATPADLNADSKFIRDVSSANLMEVRLGRLAQQKATNPAVKQFGQQMVTDHTTMQNQWTAIVSKNGMHFQPGMSSEHEQQVNRLEKVSGAEFDRAYMTAMIQDHENDVNYFQNEGRAVHSPQVRELAANDLLTIQQHLTMARQVGGQVGAAPAVVVTTQNPPVAAQNPPAAAQNAQVNESDLRADTKFIREVAADHLLEVRLGNLAERKAQDPSVKQFAQKEVNDHTSMQEHWTAMASKNGLAIKPSLGPLHQQKVNRLTKASGKQFDRAYMTLMVQQHQDDLDYYQKEGHAARLADVRELVDRDLPALQEHMNLAKQIGGKVGADTTPTRSKNVSNK